MKHRPFPVTILAVLAGIAAVLAVFHFLQALGILPYVIGPVSIRDFNLWYVIMWGLMVWVWVWLFRMLWNVESSGWMFLVIISIFNLILWYQERFVVLTREKLASLTAPGVATIGTVPLGDAPDPQLGGQYQLYLRVERVQ